MIKLMITTLTEENTFMSSPVVSDKPLIIDKDFKGNTFPNMIRFSYNNEAFIVDRCDILRALRVFEEERGV